MGRHILHVDQNCFYASVEMQRHPELRDKPLAVCGSQEERHGIVLAANYIAKPYGVKTGMAALSPSGHPAPGYGGIYPLQPDGTGNL